MQETFSYGTHYRMYTGVAPTQTHNNLYTHSYAFHPFLLFHLPLCVNWNPNPYYPTKENPYYCDLFLGRVYFRSIKVYNTEKKYKSVSLPWAFPNCSSCFVPITIKDFPLSISVFFCLFIYAQFYLYINYLYIHPWIEFSYKLWRYSQTITQGRLEIYNVHLHAFTIIAICRRLIWRYHCILFSYRKCGQFDHLLKEDLIRKR